MQIPEIRAAIGLQRTGRKPQAIPKAPPNRLKVQASKKICIMPSSASGSTDFKDSYAYIEIAKLGEDAAPDKVTVNVVVMDKALGQEIELETFIKSSGHERKLNLPRENNVELANGAEVIFKIPIGTRGNATDYLEYYAIKNVGRSSDEPDDSGHFHSFTATPYTYK